MPKLTPGNRLYLYQLLSRELGAGRQTLLPRAEEALRADGLAPEDVGCADMRALCEALPEFIKLTVFKKGYVYATVLPNEEYDRALAAGEKDAGDRAAAQGKPWKRRKGAKALRPVRPRHVERPAEPAAKAPADEPAGEGDRAATDATAEPSGPAAEGTRADEAVGADGERAGAEGAAEHAGGPVDASVDGTAPAPEPEEAPAPAAEAPDKTGADLAPGAAAEPPAPTPAPAVAPITLTITYVPEPEEAPLGPEDPAPASGAAAAEAPSPEPEPDVVPRVQADLPRDFHADVRCSSEQLSLLYQVLPVDVDPLSTLEEDFRAARATGALEGTRSNVSFSLRYLQADGVTPVRVTLRRSARAVAGKRWALVEVDAGEPAEVGLEGLAASPAGPWSGFAAAAAEGGERREDPLRTLTQTVVLGPWDEVLERLSSLAAPEDWGQGRWVLRAYLTMTLARDAAAGTLARRGGAARLRLDTGLLTAGGEPVAAELAAIPGDIPWQLEGFVADPGAERAGTPVPPALQALDPSLPAPDFSGAALVARSPRAATSAYDPFADEARLLVPDEGQALALALTPEGYVAVATLTLADAYACARVLSADQPAWLCAGRDEDAAPRA